MDSYLKDIYDYLCIKYPDRNIFCISDHHFFHNNIRNYTRPYFSDLDTMHNHIINLHNEIVKTDDVVIFLGDFSFKKGEIKSILEKMNGHKFLVLGNHDYPELVRYYGELGFENVYSVPIKINGDYFSHEPLNDKKLEGIFHELILKEFSENDGINYHGHYHETFIGFKPYQNMTCEALGYKPYYIGKTKKIEKEDKSLINSEEFFKCLEFLKTEKSIDPSFIIADYLYSLMLSSIQDNSQFYVNGSYPLYKKYNFISQFSDLDIAIIYDETLSQEKNLDNLRKIINKAYQEAMKIDDINLSFRKKMKNVRIFEALYSNKLGQFYKGYFDANLVPINVYRSSDFINFNGITALEKLTPTYLTKNFELPKYHAKFLTPNGDIANLTLQLLFQNWYSNSNEQVVKKLNYVGRNFANKNNDINYLEEVLTRFFIRNVLFLRINGRRNDIEYLKNYEKRIDDFLRLIPQNLSDYMTSIFNNPNSFFNIIYGDITDLRYSEIIPKTKEIIKSLK